MTLVELRDLSERSPPQVTGARAPEIATGDRIEAARRVEPRSELVGDGLVLDEIMCARQPDGIFVQALGVELPAFEPRDLGADECGTVPEICGAVLRQSDEPLVMVEQHLEISRALVGGRRIAACRERERGIENAFSFLDERGSNPEKLLRFRGRGQCRRVVPCVEARLQFADPIPAGGDRQLRTALQKLLEPALIELVVVEAPESPCQAAKRPNEPERPGEEEDGEAEPRLPSGLQ